MTVIRTSKVGRLPVYPGRSPLRRKKRDVIELTANMQAGNLREHFVLRKPVQVRGPSGSSVTTQQDVDLDVWGQVTPMAMPQAYYAQEFAPKADAEIKIRYRSDIRPDWQLLADDGMQYVVRGVPIDINRRRSILLLRCETLQVTSV